MSEEYLVDCLDCLISMLHGYNGDNAEANHGLRSPKAYPQVVSP